MYEWLPAGNEAFRTRLYNERKAAYNMKLSQLNKEISELEEFHVNRIAALESEKEVCGKELESCSALVKKYMSDLELLRSAQRLEIEGFEYEKEIITAVNETNLERISQEYERRIQKLSEEILDNNKVCQMAESPHLWKHLEAIVDRMMSLPHFLRLEINEDLENIRQYLCHNRSFVGLSGFRHDMVHLFPVVSVDKLIKFSVEMHMKQLTGVSVKDIG
jgi:hypothetical protein